MNERIRELARAVGFSPFDSQSELVEKFAELIVKECALAVQDFVDHRIPASEYPVKLTQHFGVE